jgi:hypothetical protein
MAQLGQGPLQTAQAQIHAAMAEGLDQVGEGIQHRFSV